MLYYYRINVISREVAMKSSDIIKDIRSRLGLSQTELAEKLGVSFASLHRSR